MNFGRLHRLFDVAVGAVRARCIYCTWAQSQRHRLRHSSLWQLSHSRHFAGDSLGTMRDVRSFGTWCQCWTAREGIHLVVCTLLNPCYHGVVTQLIIYTRLDVDQQKIPCVQHLPLLLTSTDDKISRDHCLYEAAIYAGKIAKWSKKWHDNKPWLHSPLQYHKTCITVWS